MHIELYLEMLKLYVLINCVGIKVWFVLNYINVLVGYSKDKQVHLMVPYLFKRDEGDKELNDFTAVIKSIDVSIKIINVFSKF